jgi:carboxylesterase
VNPALLLVPALALVGVANRRRVSRATEQAYDQRFARGTDGVKEGAESFTLEGTNGKALLLIHGAGDTPQSLRYLGERLHAAGFTVHAPLLPGHGRSPRAYATTTAADYREAVQASHTTLRGSHEWVGLIGLSMGAALAAQLAADVSDVPVLVMLAPYLQPPRIVHWAHGTSRVWRLWTPYIRGRGDMSIHDAAERPKNLAYGTISPGALEALIRTAAAGRRSLPRLTMPTLVIHSINDNRIPRVVAEEVLKDLAPSAERHWIDGCGHVITVDYCRDVVSRLVLTFLARHAG